MGYYLNVKQDSVYGPYDENNMVYDSDSIRHQFDTYEAAIAEKNKMLQYFGSVREKMMKLLVRVGQVKYKLRTYTFYHAAIHVETFGTGHNQYAPYNLTLLETVKLLVISILDGRGKHVGYREIVRTMRDIYAGKHVNDFKL